MKDETVFSYDFSKEELLKLIQFFRLQESNMPLELHAFFSGAEKQIYRLLTVEEAENIFL